MKNLEEQCLEKLNKLLKLYNLIIKPIYPNSIIYPEAIKLCNFGLFKLNDEYHICSYCWNTIYDMLYSNMCIFNVCHEINFCKGDSLEEIIIKCDLMG
jgi:hypothetical protein